MTHETTTEASTEASPSDLPRAQCCGTGGVALPREEAELLADQLGAVADPVRLQVLSIIANSPAREVCACDFVGPVGKSQPTISHHLKVLSDAGLVQSERRGRWIWYSLAGARLNGLIDSLTSAASGPV